MTVLLWNARMTYGSYGDEKAFFTWLESISGVTRVVGSADHGLVIHLRSKRLSQSALRDLLAIYRRYVGDMSQLAQFLTPENESWFKSPEKYWYKAVFKTAPRDYKAEMRRRRLLPKR